MRRLFVVWSLLVGFVVLGPAVVGGVAAAGGDYVPIAPVRVVDTRPGFSIDVSGVDPKGVRVDGSILRVKLGGRGGVPAGVSGVVLNMASVGAADGGHVSVFACGGPRPSTANLNFRAGETVSNMVMAQVGSSGDVCVFVRGSTHLVVDVFGYVPAGGTPMLSSPVRLADTRPGRSIDVPGADPKGVRTDGSVLRVQAAGRGGVPAGVSGVVLNVAVVGAVGDGHVTVYACDRARPSTANLNLRGAETVSNLVVSEVGSSGEVCLFVRGSTHLVVDVFGSVPAGGSPELLSPVRMADTRPGFSIDVPGADPKGVRSDGSVLRVKLAGRGGVPADVSAAVLNVATVGADGAGHVTVYGCNGPKPSTANLNLRPGAAVSNMVMSEVGSSGEVCLFVRGSTHLVVDVFGYIGGTTVNPPTPTTTTTTTTAPTTTTTTTTVAPTTTTTTTTAPATTTTTTRPAVTTTTTRPPVTTTTTTRPPVTTTTTTRPPVTTTTTTRPPVTTTTTTTPATTTTTTSTTVVPQPPPTPDGEFKETFTLPPGGSDSYLKELYETSNAGPSRMEPVGLYLDEGDVVYIELSGGIHVSALVGVKTDLYYEVQTTELGNGLNQLVATQEGPLFLENLDTELTATATVHAAAEIKRIPVFRLGKNTDAQVEAGVRAATDVPKFFLVGKYFMAYVSREAYLSKNRETGTQPIVVSPMAWLAKRDRDVRLYHEYVGRIEGRDFSNANSYPTTREFITTQLGGYMGTASRYIGVASDYPPAMSILFDMDERPPTSQDYALSWGIWHEMGHHQQQPLYSFEGSAEANANIYAGMLSIKSPNGYGIGNWHELLPETVYAEPDAPADATGLEHEPMWHMFSQLYAAFGEAFYTRLHHDYRLLDHQTKATITEQKKFSLFVYMSSKSSGYDLRSFFEAWRFPLDAEYNQKIEDLNLPEPSTDLSKRTLLDITSEADLEGRYEKKLQPYTNLPYADAKSSFMFSHGRTPSPYELINYDPAVVAKAEFLNPEESPFTTTASGKDYGETMVEILLTGHDGQQNVVVATGMIKPPEWNVYSLHSSVYNQVTDYVNSANFKAGNVDVAEAQKNLEMIHGTNHRDTAPLIAALRYAIDHPKVTAYGYPLPNAYFHSLSDADTLMYRGRPAMRMDATAWKSMITTGQLSIRAYETNIWYPYHLNNDKHLGYMQNTAVNPISGSLNVLKYDIVGSTAIVYVDLPFGEDLAPPGAKNPDPFDEVTFDIAHVGPLGIKKRFITIASNRVGATDQISGHWVDAQFRADMTYLDGGAADGDLVYSLPTHAWEMIKARGSLSLEFYRNGTKIASSNGTNGAVPITITPQVVTLRVPNPGLAEGDYFELKGMYTSNDGVDLNGRIYLKMTANMLDPNLPVRLS